MTGSSVLGPDTFPTVVELVDFQEMLEFNTAKLLHTGLSVESLRVG